MCDLTPFDRTTHNPSVQGSSPCCPTGHGWRRRAATVGGWPAGCDHRRPVLHRVARSRTGRHPDGVEGRARTRGWESGPVLVDHEGRAVRRAAPTLLPRRGLRALPPVSTRARTSREETAQIGAVRTPTHHGPRRRRTAVGAGPADSPGRTRPVLTPQPAPPPVLPPPVPPRACRASSPTTTTVPCGLQDRNPPNAVVSARLPQAGRRDPSCHRARADRSARSNFVTGQGPVETPA